MNPRFSFRFVKSAQKLQQERMEMLPRRYRNMFMAFVNDPPTKGSELDHALDLFFMSHQYLGGGAWNDLHLARCLAWAMLRGFPECVVVTPMRIPVLLASYRYCLRGGCVPDVDAMREDFIPCVRELHRLQDKTPWLPALMARYKIDNWQCSGSQNYYDWTDKSMKRFFGLRRKFFFFKRCYDNG